METKKFLENNILFANAINTSWTSDIITDFENVYTNKCKKFILKSNEINRLKDLSKMDIYEYNDSNKIFIRPFFDIDYKWNKYDENLRNRIKDAAVRMICYYFICDEKDIAICHDIKNNKCSLHLNIINIYTTMFHLKMWATKHKGELKSFFKSNDNETFTDKIEFDVSVYKIGYFKIIEILEKQKKLFGDKFDIKSFHDNLLKNGTVPLFILEKNV